MQTDRNLVVVGGGLGGMAAALRCRNLGLNVTLVERLHRLGGRAQVFERNGFKFDAGPTVITAPFLFDELFSLFNENLSDFLDFRPLKVWYRYHFHDGSQFDYSGNEEEMERQIRLLNPIDVAGYKKLIEHSKKIFDVGFTELSDVPFNKFVTMLKQIPALIKLRADRSVSGMIRRYIHNEKLQRAFSIHPLLVGGNPYSTTSIYTLIHYLEQKWGVHFCMGGTGKLVDELEKLMRRQKITIITNEDVDEIRVTGKKVTEVNLKSGKSLTADFVVCNADPPTVYREMLVVEGNSDKRRRLPLPENFTKYSMGLFVLFFGTKKQYPEIAHHTIWLGEQFKSLLSDIFDEGVLSDDFSLYVHRPTATDPSFAPDGSDSFYVLCPVPNLKWDLDWNTNGELLKNKIVVALSRTIMPGLQEVITEEFWMDPTSFKNDYRSTHGAGFSIAPIFRQSAWFRYHNVDKYIHNLFFVGAGTHPVAGLPGVISSAKVIEKLINSDLNLTTPDIH